jgi:Spy/CpxP family protein refolding chaperone
VWWNNPKLVAALRLTEAQRAKMNELLVHRLENQRAIKSDYLEKRAAFEQALRKGNPQAAQAAAVELRKRVAEGSEGRFALVIDVVAVLEPAQRETLFSQYPATLRRPLWKRVHSFSPRERAEPQ